MRTVRSGVSEFVPSLALMVALVVGVPAPVHADTEISVFVPPFFGPPGLSSSVSTILRLQIWQSLRRSDRNAGGPSSFGSGVVKWGPHALPSLAHASAEAFANHARVLSQIVLWGTVQQYGGGAIVQSFLSIPEYPPLNTQYYSDFRKERKEVWVIRIPVPGRELVFKHDVPRRRMSFEPIVLSGELIKSYSNVGAIRLYSPSNPNKPIGSVSNVITAIEQRGDAALVTSGGVTGIVYLPELSKNRSEVVDFVSGLVRVFRGDWAGADAALNHVIENPNAPTDVRIDAHLYRAFAKSKLGRSGEEDITRALDLNPFADRTLRFAIMETLGRLQRVSERNESAPERRSLIAKARGLVESSRKLSTRDSWLGEILSGLRQLDDVK